MKRIATLILLFLLGSFPAISQSSFSGPWHGAITIGAMSLLIGVNLTQNGNGMAGTIDIPQQSAKNLPLTNVLTSGDSIRFQLPSPLGTAWFYGRRNGDSIKGTFTQAPVAGSFSLSPGLLPVEKDAIDNSPVPYKQEEVTFHNGDVKLAGTLTIPEGSGPFPALVMITGSGAQDRNEELFGFKPFKVIADYFTRRGIAVLRYDDRGVGGSTGVNSESTTSDFANDAIAGIQLLKTHSQIDPKHLGLMGHSEGGIAAPLAATRSPDVKFIVLMAGTGIRGDSLLFMQQRAIAKASGTPELTVENGITEQREIFDVMRHGKLDSLRDAVVAEAKQQLASLSEEQRKEKGDVGAMVDAQLAQFRSPWFRYFVDYDPSLALAKVKIPVLMFFGALDTQVPAGPNKAAMEAALRRAGNTNVTTIILPNANHLFITATTGSPSEYATLKKEFVPEFLPAASSWILKTTGHAGK